MSMRPEGSPLDLNNFPEEYGTQQALEESSTTTAASSENSRFKKKKKDGKDESGTIYECRFCSLKFCKSQALGGHMNRHRQERETETLNRARQLVFSNDGITGGGGTHMGLRDISFGSSMQATQSSCFHQVGNVGDPRLHFGPLYPRIPAPLPQSQHLQPYMYASPSPPPQSSYPPTQTAAARPPSLPPVNDYYVGRVLASSPRNQRQSPGHPFLGTSPPGAGPEPPSRPPMDGGSWIYGHRFVQHGNTYPSSVDRPRDEV